MMEFFKVQSVDSVFEIMTKEIKAIEKIEEVPLEEALNRILAEDVIANEDVPDFSKSIVDGYAVHANDTHGANETLPSFLDYVGEIRIGDHVQLELQRGQTMYIPTGGMLPKGCDAVVMVEDTETIDNIVNIYRPVAKNENTIFKGEDAKVGDLLIPKGKRLRSQELGSLASLGITKVKVFKQLKIGYLSSGDEIVEYKEQTVPIGKVRDVNGVTIPALTKRWGYDVQTSSIARDNFDDLYKKAKALFDECDAFIISGGSSVGTRDFTTEVIEALGDNKPGILVHGVSVKPGKPTIFSLSSGKPILGLPGHPASAMIIYQVFGKKMLSLLQGETVEEYRQMTQAVVSQNIPSIAGRTDYIRVKLKEEDGYYKATPIIGKSGLVKTLVDSDGLLEIKENKEGVLKGEVVTVHLF